MDSRLLLSNGLLRGNAKTMMTPKSGLFLGGCCVAAIAAVGSIFELASGEPELGSVVTSIILVISIPLGGFLFFAAVRDANANN